MSETISLVSHAVETSDIVFTQLKTQKFVSFLHLFTFVVVYISNHAYFCR